MPSRPTAVDGSTVYTGAGVADDSDGDGIPDASDDCPNVFNPIRPMDNGNRPTPTATAWATPATPRRSTRR